MITTIGVDLAKSVFHVHGVDSHGKVVVRKRVPRGRFMDFMAKQAPCLVGMEACASAHYWARRTRALGHDVKLMSPQFVKPYVKGNKNDGNDAEGICEAVSRPNMRFVPVKNVEQQDVQSLHRIREQYVKNRTALINQIRGLLGEYGIVLPQGSSRVRQEVPLIVDDDENELSDFFRDLLRMQLDHLRFLEQRVDECDKKIKTLSKNNEACQRLLKVPGLGPVTVTALVSAVGNAKDFKNGRQLAAWLGLVPRQWSTGGKPRLLGISKRGDRYLRKNFVHGARSVVSRASSKESRSSRWVSGVEERRGRNVAIVAVQPGTWVTF
jgi:transposase